MKTLGVQELIEHIDEILRMIKEEGETVEVVDEGEVIARLVPPQTSEQQTQDSIEEASDRAWANLERLSAELGKYWPSDVSAVDAVRDVRRDL